MQNKITPFAANFIGFFLSGFFMVIISSTLPLLKEKFGMTDIEASSLFSILPVGVLIGSITFGPIADRYGYCWVLSTASLFLGDWVLRDYPYIHHEPIAPLHFAFRHGWRCNKRCHKRLGCRVVFSRCRVGLRVPGYAGRGRRALQKCFRHSV